MIHRVREGLGGRVASAGVRQTHTSALLERQHRGWGWGVGVGVCGTLRVRNISPFVRKLPRSPLALGSLKSFQIQVFLWPVNLFLSPR